MMTGARLTAATGETPQPKESTDNLGFHKPVESGGPSGSGVAERELQRFNGRRFIKKVMRRRRGVGLDIRLPGLCVRSSANSVVCRRNGLER